MRDDAFELPLDRQAINRKAIRLEWVTIVFFATAVTLMYLALGSSQAMKAAWVEDLLAFVPPIAFLIAERVRYKRPNDDYPYGYHRVVAVGYLVASLSLAMLGLFILYDSVMKLIAFEHPPVGLVQPFGEPVWLGWFMIGALAYTMIPAVILGRLKLPLAKQLHDKILFADAEMNKADWMTAGAAIVGIIGIRFGVWWTDAAAAILISLNIVYDGFKNTRAATGELMDKRPVLVGDEGADPLPSRVRTELMDLPWVEDARVRLREQGHVFYGEALVVPNDQRNLGARVREATAHIMALDWRLHDVVISVVDSLEKAAGTVQSASKEPHGRDGKGSPA
jgi:cation diffusion facilitator family transporter